MISRFRFIGPDRLRALKPRRAEPAALRGLSDHIRRDIGLPERGDDRRGQPRRQTIVYNG